MSEDPQVDHLDGRIALSATGRLRDWNLAGLVDAADVHVATRLGDLAGEDDESVRLALALTVAAARGGSVCLDPADPRLVAAVPGCEPPPAADWLAAIRRSPLTSDHGLATGDQRPLRWDGDRLYLERYWRDETAVAHALLTREAAPPPEVDPELLAQALDEFFPAVPATSTSVPPTSVSAGSLPPATGPDRTREMARAAALRWTSVLGGGPGTGKTTTVARLLGVLDRITTQATGRPPRIALAAPTGKAAARLSESVRSQRVPAAGLGEPARRPLDTLTASTLHRLLGAVPGRGFRHHRENRLPHDIVVVDEASMVPLTLMARLLDAIGPDTRLILVGDPAQLASVDAGAVLADIAEGLGERPGSVVLLTHTWRHGGAIADLAAAVRAGDADRAEQILTSGDDAVQTVRDGDLSTVAADVVRTGLQVRRDALAGRVLPALAGVDTHRLLCAHRTGPAGVQTWQRRIELWLAAAHGGPETELWYPGRPLLVTANDPGLKLFNGDTGVVVTGPDGHPLAAFGQGGGQWLNFRPSRLGQVETVHAMTVHRSQGSQFDRVTLILPEPDSPLLSRELVYTALTRAKHRVRIVGSAESFRQAVLQPATRASGLARRLRL